MAVLLFNILTMRIAAFATILLAILDDRHVAEPLYFGK